MRFDQVRTPRELLNEHIKQETTFFYKTVFSVAIYLFSWNRRDVQSWEAFTKRLSQSCKVAVPTIDFETGALKNAVASVNYKVSALWQVRVRHRIVTCSLLSSESFLYFELAHQLTVVFRFLHINHGLQLTDSWYLHRFRTHHIFAEQFGLLLCS